jgi:hypothetical protein
MPKDYAPLIITGVAIIVSQLVEPVQHDLYNRGDAVQVVLRQVISKISPV